MSSTKDTFSSASLQGKVAVITGSTQGLGEATARLFKERGIRGLIITGRNAERGQAVAASLTEGACTAHFVQADLGNIEDCRRIIKASDEHFGTLHILVNAGAFTARGSIWDTTPELYDQMMNINTRAPFFLTQDAIRIMEREGVEGSIVNISSVAAYGSLPMLAPYAISKGALNVATKHVAYAVMRSRIRVNALAIGWMDTPGEDVTQRQYHATDGGDDWLATAEAQQPFGRLLKTEEVARCIAYCASDESGMMTGCVINFDQSVWGGGPAPIPPPKDQWTKAEGVSYSFK
jgi:NAD(P)-dependent dehydrogenase (short-subunit alcohol dehydrogenase family)